MADVVKHVFKYGELRQTLYLNLAGKDDLGRHRGHVLYGMKIRPIAGSGGGATSNQISIGSGALYTPFGTKLYFDVENPSEPSINTIDLTSFMTNPSRPKPMVLGIYMKFANDAQQSASLESASDLNSVSFDLVARVVAWSRETGGPVMTLAPLNPVTMDANTPQPLSYSHIDTSDRSAVVHNGPPTGVYEIPIGYIIVGGYTSGGIEHEPTAIYDVAGVGQWAAGVECVQLDNPWANLADVLGFDPLEGRTEATVAPNSDNADFTALSQAAGNYPIGASRMPSMATPKLGTTVPAVANDPWDVPWSLYRLPSFFRDGEQLLWNLRRLDYMLRLWMNRTGAQGLVSIIQDGSTGLPKQAPLEKILAAFQAGTTSNLNEIIFADVEVDANARHANVTVANSPLKSGFIEHLPHTAEQNLSSEFGDSYEVALTALNRAIFHILTDVIGKDFDRSALRLPANQLWRTLTTPPANLRWTDKADRPTRYGAPLTPYMNMESLYAAVEVIAARALCGAAHNLLVNPVFLDDSIVPAGTLYGWTLTGGGSIARTTTASTNAPARFAVATIAIADAGKFSQTIDFTALTGLLRSLTVGTPLLSAVANLRVLSGSVQLVVKGLQGATTVFSVTSVVRSATTDPADLSFSFKPGTVPVGVDTLEISIIPGAGGASVDLYGVHFGAGVPVSNTLTREYANFLPLGAGPAYPLRNHLYGGAHQAKEFANATAPQDLTTLSQVTTALAAEAQARSDADAAEQAARIAADAPMLTIPARVTALEARPMFPLHSAAFAYTGAAQTMAWPIVDGAPTGIIYFLLVGAGGGNSATWEDWPVTNVGQWGGYGGWASGYIVHVDNTALEIWVGEGGASGWGQWGGYGMTGGGGGSCTRLGYRGAYKYAGGGSGADGPGFRYNGAAGNGGANAAQTSGQDTGLDQQGRAGHGPSDRTMFGGVRSGTVTDPTRNGSRSEYNDIINGMFKSSVPDLIGSPKATTYCANPGSGYQAPRGGNGYAILAW